MDNSKKTNKCLGTLAYKDSCWTNQRYTGQTTPFNKRRWEGEMTASMGNVEVKYNGSWKEDVMAGDKGHFVVKIDGKQILAYAGNMLDDQF